MQIPDISGRRFGSLLVQSRAENNSSGSATWNCLCDCGEMRRIAGTSLRAGRHKSCGCMSPRFTAERLTTHGASKTSTYRIWHGMKLRCSTKARGRTRKNYYAKGIRVCERWMAFQAFISDMGERPDGMTIERIDGSKGYQPDNCRWATLKEQANNTTKNCWLSHNGDTFTVSGWAERLSMNPNTLLYRLRRGWSVDRALITKVQPRLT